MKCLYIVIITVNFSLLMTNCNIIAQNYFRKSVRDIIDSDTSKIIKQVFRNSKAYKLKIIFSKVCHTKNGSKYLASWSYRDKVSEYFYPASLVKLPMALITMQFINENKMFNPGLSEIIIDSSDISIKNNLHDDLMLMLSVSENYPFNRLYNLVGPEYIQKLLAELKFKNTFLIHRFEPGNQYYQQSALPVSVVSDNNHLIFSHPLIKPENIINNGCKDCLIGKACYDDNKLVNKPKNFSYYNYIDIRDIHDMLISLIYPGLSHHHSFKINDSQRKLLMYFLKMRPSQLHLADYSDTLKYNDNYLNFILFGGQKDVKYPDIAFYNKAAYAYGFMADCAYVRDMVNDIEFFLTIYIYVNKKDIINSDSYEYESVGAPFMKRIGELLYFGLKNNKIICSDNKNRN